MKRKLISLAAAFSIALSVFAGALPAFAENLNTEDIGNSDIGDSIGDSMTPGGSSGEDVILIKGDINGDGVVDISDIVLARSNIVGNIDFTENQIFVADVTYDGYIDISDVVTLRYMIVNSLTAEEIKDKKDSNNIGDSDNNPGNNNKDPDDKIDTSVVIATLPVTKPAGQAVKLIKVKDNYTNIYNNNIKSDYIAPVFSQLPKGTLEYYSSASEDMVIAESARKYDKDKVEIINGTTFGDNKVEIKSIEDSKGATVLKIKMTQKTAFNIQAGDIQYNYLNDYDYFYTVDTYNPTYVRITFDNVTAVTQLPEFENGSDLFTSAQWTMVKDNGVQKFALKLMLRQAGIYNGSNANYDSEGNLIVKFTKYPKSLSEAIVVIDPGHGLGDPGASRSGINESNINAVLADKTAQKLRAAGATVYVLPTATENIYYKERAARARQYNPDIFISIHCNSTESLTTTARGAMTFYYNSFSQPLAQGVVKNVTSALGYSNISRPCLQDAYSVTVQNDFSSLLLETAFMSNSEDLAILTNSAKQDAIASAVVNGVKEFCSRKK